MTCLRPYVFVAAVRNLVRARNRSRLRLEARRHSRRALSVTLLISLLINSTPAAAATLVSAGKELHVILGFWLEANNLPSKMYRKLTGQDVRPQVQERQEDRDSKVERIQIYPGDVTISVEERVNLAAVAYDNEGNAIGGIRMKWSARDQGRNHATRITQQGEFQSFAPGRFTVTVEGARKKVQATIEVIDGPRRDKTGPPLRTKQVSTRDLPGAATDGSGKKQERHHAHASKRSGVPRSFSSSTKAPVATPAMPLLPQDEWGGDNYWSADDPGNRRGDPPGTPMDDGAGSGNFQLTAPVLSLAGRGLDTSLALAYNSRLWNKAGTTINYDIDRDWPAPGWSLGFGKLVGMGVNNGGMLIDADGTRHGYTGTVTTYSWGTSFTGHTTDGTLIDYSYFTGSGGVLTSAQATLPNGAIIYYYTQGTGALYPTQVVDADGNFITITYVNNHGPRIQTITDTLGRPINFHYDSSNLLTAITAPGLSGGTRTLVRLHYCQLALSYSFSGLTPSVRDANPWVIDAIYYPGTGTGYWFGDSASAGYLFGNTDSYSTYGMLAKVVEARGMTFSGPDPIPVEQGPTGQGTITPAGQMSRKHLYNYPLFVGDSTGTQSSNLTDAPTYTSFTETWTTDGVNTGQAVTLYEVHQDANPRSATITYPNGTKSTQLSYNAPNQWNDGLAYHDETYVTAGTILQSSNTTWQAGAYDSPRPTRVETTNERNQTITSEFSYGTVRNQVTEVRNYDFGGVLARLTRTEYQNDANYANRHIFNLPLIVEIYAGDNTRVSRTEYQYDGQTLLETPGVVMHLDSHNPYAPEYLVEYCAEYDYWYINCVRWESYWTSDYNPTTAYRGNVTQTTTYADAVNLTSPITETRRYDITGNAVTVGSSCCEQTSFTYTDATQYAFPSSQTTGSPTDGYAQITTSVTYDFNTGLALSTTDANGRVAQTTYSAGTLRAQTVSLPAGGHTDYAYDDTAISVTDTTYLESHPTHSTIAAQNIKLFTGRGEVRQEKALGTGGVWDIMDMEYDSMGRKLRQSRPYRSGDTVQWTTAAYDALGRATRITTPDGSVTETYYNERDFDLSDSYVPTRPDAVSQTAPGDTKLVRDPWGRERWGRTDAFSRLVEVVEPNPSGSGSIATGGLPANYSYNTLGNLVQVTQGAQTRSFKYDSLGRLAAQKLAETSATLNDAGTYVGSGTWSEVLTYDERSNLTSRTDARGVKTVYTFSNDPLSRLQSVSWDTSGFGDTANPILGAATITYQYRAKSSPSDLVDVTQLSSVTTSGVSTQSFAYDAGGRATSKTFTLTSRPSYPFAIDYIYDALDRAKDVRYPAEYGNGTQPRKVVHENYDVASRLSGLTLDGQNLASNIVYNADSQATSLSVGFSGPNQMIESYSYEAQTGLMSGQTAARYSAPGTPLLDLSYDYAGTNGKRSGQLTKILNNRNHSKDRGYTYDALGRLIQAKGGPSGTLWTQNYSYDRYGNRTSVSASGTSAKAGDGKAGSAGVLTASAQRQVGGSESGNANAKEGANEKADAITSAQPADPQVVLPTEQLAAKTEVALPESLRTDLPRSISDSSFHHGARASTVAPMTPQGGPPVFTDNPIEVGTTVIKAVHITELRTAVNQARSLGGLATANWAEAVTSGVTIKGGHITELRLRLDEARAALGLSAASYTDPTLSVSATLVKAVHITELRQRVTEALAGPAGCPPGQSLTVDLFVKNFYQGALARQPNSTELQSWTDQLRQAYFQGQAQLLATAQYFGRQLFKSQEYINRNRSDHEFVYDLYKGYLQRDPDQGGWDFWTNLVPSSGRDSVRDAFAVSTEFANKVASLCAVNAGGSTSIPLDGIANLSYDVATNRITTAGFQYDAAGNQTRKLRSDGSAQRFQYDAANRLVKVTDDYAFTLSTYTYADSNERIVTEGSGVRTYYVWDGAVTAEYYESEGSTTPQWTKSYIYLGERLLASLQPNGSGGEAIQYHHPDRLGTRLVTNAQDTTYFEQQTLPYGTGLYETPDSGAGVWATNWRFTSYDRSVATGLDYAVNRHYDAEQGRFTQADPIGMNASSLGDPQSFNLYAYCGNDPVNRVDPDGLFWGKLWRALKTIFKWLAVAAAVAVAVLTIIYAGPLFTGVLKTVLGIIAAVANAASSVLKAFGLSKAAAILGIIAAAATFGTSLFSIAAKGAERVKTIFKAIADGAALANKSLTLAGYNKLAVIFDLVNVGASFVFNGFKPDRNENDEIIKGKFHWGPKPFEIFKLIRGTAERVAVLSGSKRVGDYLNVLGLIDDIGDLYLGIAYFNKDEKGGDLSAKVGSYPQSMWAALNKQIRLQGRIMRLGLLVGKVNSAFGRVEKGVALAH